MTFLLKCLIKFSQRKNFMKICIFRHAIIKPLTTNLITTTTTMTCQSRTETCGHPVMNSKPLSATFFRSCGAVLVPRSASAVPCEAAPFVSRTRQVSDDVVVSSQSASPPSDSRRMLPPPYSAPSQPVYHNCLSENYNNNNNSIYFRRQPQEPRHLCSLVWNKYLTYLTDVN